jgi:hypothetical protein
MKEFGLTLADEHGGTGVFYDGRGKLKPGTDLGSYIDHVRAHMRELPTQARPVIWCTAQASLVSAYDYERMSDDVRRYSLKVHCEAQVDPNDASRGTRERNFIYIAHKRANWIAYIGHKAGKDRPNTEVFGGWTKRDARPAQLRYKGASMVPGGCFLSFDYGDNYFEKL